MAASDDEGDIDDLQALCQELKELEGLDRYLAVRVRQVLCPSLNTAV